MKRLYLDLAERCFWTFVETFLGLVVVQAAVGGDLTSLRTAAAGGVAAALALVKGFAATRIGSPASAATLPAGAE